MDLIIRGYAPGDRDSVNRTALAAFAQYEGEYDDWAAFSAGIGRMADLADGAELVVAERDAQVIGAVAYIGPGRASNPVFPDAWSVIRLFVVAPGHRGLGVGRRLVEACLQAARRDQAPAVGLHTSPIMASALRLYGALGFQRDSDLPPIKGVPYGRYVLPAAGIDAALELLRDNDG
jgi:GNAT superfamily N-acetyltransferase